MYINKYYKSNKNKNKKTKKSKIKGGKPHEQDISVIEEDNPVIEISDILRDIPSTEYIAFHPELPLIAILHDNRVQIWKINIINLSVNFMHIIDTPVSFVYNQKTFVFHPTKPELAVKSEGIIKLYRNIDNLETIQCFATITPDAFRRENVDIILTSFTYHRTLPIVALGLKISDSFLSDEPENVMPDIGSAEIWHVTPDGLTTLVTIIEEIVRTMRRHRFIEIIGSPVSQMDFHHELPLIAIITDEIYIHMYEINIEQLNVYRKVFQFQGNYVSFHKNLRIFLTKENNKIILWDLPEDLSQINQLMNHTFLGNTITKIALHPYKMILAVEQIVRTQLQLRQLTVFSISRHDADWYVTSEGSSHLYDAINPHYNYISIHSRLPIICTWNRMSIKLWMCKILGSDVNNFILYSKKTDVDESICNRFCSICNLNLCIKNPSNPNNNINGYVVKLINDASISYSHLHYSCLHYYLINIGSKYNHLYITSDISHALLNISNKSHAIAGINFYN